MKLNIAHPDNGTCKQFEVNEEALRRFDYAAYRLGSEVEGHHFGEEYNGYVFRIHGGSDKDGFPMMHGVFSDSRVDLLLKRGYTGFQAFRGSEGERRRKTVRGCIANTDVAVLNVVVRKIGEKPIEGVTNATNARRLGPKRANKIRKQLNLTLKDEVRRFIVRRKCTGKNKKERSKAAHVQRVVDSTVRARRAAKVTKAIASLRSSAAARREYAKGVAKARMAARQRKNAAVHRRKVNTERADMAAFKKAGAPKAAAPKAKVAGKK